MIPYYQDDAVTIYHGDCREILRNIDRVELVITDPPYASGARTDSNRQVRGSMLRALEDEEWFSHDAMTTWGLTWFLRGVFVDLRELIIDGAHLYVFTDWRQTPNIYGMMESAGYRVNHCLVWSKKHFGMGAYWRNQHENIVFGSRGMPTAMLDRGRGSVIEISNVNPADREHPTEKPLDLLLSIMSAAPGNLVLDPFMGSGTTLRAAKDLGRKAIGIEIEEKYCEIAAKRMSQEVLQF